MTLPSATNSNEYTGNGAVGTYAYGYKILDEDHLTVVIADADGVETDPLTITTDYTVDGVGDASGGNVTLVENGQDWTDGAGNLKDGYIINIRRVVPLTQLTDIRNQGPFFPETYEDALDYLMMCIHQLKEQADRAVLAGVTESSTTVTALSASIAAAQAAETNSESAQAAAEAAQTAAEAAKTAAQAAQTGAELAETNAEAAQAASEAALASFAGVESGFIFPWNGAVSAIPSGYVICDGNNGTSDLTGRNLVHADADSGGTYNVNAQGGADTHLHTVDPPSTTSGGVSFGGGGSLTAGALDTAHTHAVDIAQFNSGSQSSLSKYHAKAHIMKT